MKHFFNKRRIKYLLVVIILGFICYMVSPFLFGLYAIGFVLSLVSLSFGKAFDKNEDFADKNNGASQKMGDFDGKTDNYLDQDYK